MRDAAGNRADLFSLFKETVALYHRLTAEASAIHRRGSLSGPRRTVLVALSQSGPQTVARLARTRAQARQRLQPLVNGLIQEGLAKAVENPMHVQSPLIVLTAKGEKEVRQILTREADLQSRLRLHSSARSVAAAVAVLRDVRGALEQQLPAMLARRRRSR